MAVSRYIVPNVPLIAQDLGMACWYASTQMLIQWRRETTQSTEADLPDPSEVPDAVATYKANNGLSFAQFAAYSKMMGLVAVPGMSPTVETIADWLHVYGPIWAAGYKVTPTKKYGHVFVICGIGPGEIVLHDPEPVGVGTLLVTSAEDWLDTLLDIGRYGDVTTNFLHFPG
jgi:papain like cysteine protease AvrRpt2